MNRKRGTRRRFDGVDRMVDEISDSRTCFFVERIRSRP
jgi:hypothetical protein